MSKKALFWLSLIFILSTPCYAAHRVSGDLYVTGNTGIGTTVPIASLDVLKTAKFGISPNYTSTETDGTVVFNGNATVWEDLQVTLNSATAVNAPGITTKYGGRLYTFSDEAVNEDQLPFVAQIPHSYKASSDVLAHVHYTGEDATACNFRWGLQYRWTSINSQVSATNDIAVIDSANATSTVDIHTIADFPTLPGVNKGISSIITGTLYRNSSNALDTCDAKSAYLLAFDLHYESDTVGSRSQSSK